MRTSSALFVVAAAACGGSGGSDDPRTSESDESGDGPLIVEATPEAVRAAFAAEGKRVVTLAGYSGTGYEDEAAMLDRVRRELRSFDPGATLVNIGATVDGIGAAYEVAASMGFETTGIVSSQAREEGATFSPFVDRIYVVPDARWGGLVEETGRLSPTSEAMVSVSDVVIGIGGGAVSRDEMVAARERGKEVRFFPADLNHRRAIEVAEEQGGPAPTDFRGAAHAVFGDVGAGR